MSTTVQSTAGIKLFYGTSTVTDGVPAVPSSWTAIPDITGTPALGSEPNQLETTTLAETVQKTYIAGLQDLGGSFAFPANFTAELIDAVDAAAVDPGTGYARAFLIDFPAPLNVGYWWTGETQAVAPGEMGVDQVVTTTVYVSQATALTKIDSSAIS